MEKKKIQSSRTKKIGNFLVFGKIAKKNSFFKVFFRSFFFSKTKNKFSILQHCRVLKVQKEKLKKKKMNVVIIILDSKIKVEFKK